MEPALNPRHSPLPCLIKHFLRRPSAASKPVWDWPEIIATYIGVPVIRRCGGASGRRKTRLIANEAMPFELTKRAVDSPSRLQERGAVTQGGGLLQRLRKSASQ
ncbi:hypothetical protein CNECB9_800015 [Cupriavidus necator]|uniref:Uncharacterized protein n=1 Tax=Cupriavidus necator TaxID=106590 RepID=A0A1K0ISC5_CUPNE|nr:hypothetical protein CNECB9_800015 [Cupriavidus necator]